MGDFLHSIFISGNIIQAENKETRALNDILDQRELIGIYGAYHSKATEWTFFSSAHGAFSRNDHILGH